MILINFLPQEFRIKKKEPIKLPYLKGVIAVVVVFAIFTGKNYIEYWASVGKLKKMEKEWIAVQPQQAEITKLQGEIDALFKPEKDFLAGFVDTGKPLTHLLGWASEFLPVSAWLETVSLERKGEAGELTVKGYCLGTKDKSSIELIETYLHELKAKIFDANLSLTTSRTKFKGTELTQFTASFTWGTVVAKK